MDSFQKVSQGKMEMSEAVVTPAPPVPRPAISYDLKELFRRLFTRGTSTFIIIFGRRETGKTDFAFLICEILYALGIVQHVATNTRVYDAPFPIARVTSLEELTRWSEQNEGRKIFVFDEMGKAYRRRTPMSSLNIKLIDKMQVLRKHKLSIIGIAPADKYVDSASLGSDVLDAVFLKPNYKNPKVALYQDVMDGTGKTIRDIPPTVVKFDQWDVAPFTERNMERLPAFKDKDKELLWKWCHGATAKDLGLFPMQVNRLLRKFVKDVLEHEYNA